MSSMKYAGLGLLTILWLWLAIAVLKDGFDLYHLLVVAISGIIIFVPLARKFSKKQ